MAMQYGNADAIKAYGNLVLTLHAEGHIDDVELRTLLITRDETGESGLHGCVRAENKEALDAYLHVVEQAPRALRAGLLETTVDNGHCGIVKSFETRQPKLVKNLLAAHRQAFARDAITLHELAGLAKNPAFAAAARNSGRSSASTLAYRDHLMAVSRLIFRQSPKDEALEAIAADLRRLLATR